MATRIDTVASRDKLKPRREPYWHRLRRGCYLGYRKMTTDGDGVWIARARDEASGPTKQCARRPNFDPPCRLNFDQGWKPVSIEAGCG
jgi:hypothetical protein